MDLIDILDYSPNHGSTNIKLVQKRNKSKGLRRNYRKAKKKKKGENSILEAKGECFEEGSHQYQKWQCLIMTENRPPVLAIRPLSISGDWSNEGEVQGNGAEDTQGIEVKTENIAWLMVKGKGKTEC